MFSNAERHVLKYRKACSQIQKGPFFCLNTHASCSCEAKQIYIKIKYSSPHKPSILPTHFPSTPSPLPFRSHPTPRPSAAPPPLRYSPNLFICYPVFYYKQHIPLSPRYPVHLPHSPVSSRIQLVHSSPHQLVNLPVTHRTCSPVTLSFNTANLPPRPLVNPSTCKLFLSSYFFVGTCLKHCNANSSLFVTNFYRQKNNYQ